MSGYKKSKQYLLKGYDMIYKKTFCTLVLGLIILLPKEAWVGTYSGYVKYFDGFAIWVDINIGSMVKWVDKNKGSIESDGSAEFDELQKQRQLHDKALSDSDARFIQLFRHFTQTQHPYRRHLERLFSGRHPQWHEPEQMWASELTTTSVKIPPSYIKKPQAEKPVLSRYRDPDAVSFTLYLKKNEPKEIRDALIGQFIASQITPGGMFHDIPELDSDESLTKEMLVKQLMELAGSLQPYNLTKICELALHHRTDIRKLSEFAPDSSLTLMAVTLRSWLDQQRLNPAELEQIAKATTGQTLPYIYQVFLFDQDIALLEKK